MEKESFIESLIRASIDGFIAGFGRIKNKRDFFLLENALKNIVKDYTLDKELIEKSYKKVLGDIEKNKNKKLYSGFYKIKF